MDKSRIKLIANKSLKFSLLLSASLSLNAIASTSLSAGVLSSVNQKKPSIEVNFDVLEKLKRNIQEAQLAKEKRILEEKAIQEEIAKSRIIAEQKKSADLKLSEGDIIPAIDPRDERNFVDIPKELELANDELKESYEKSLRRHNINTPKSIPEIKSENRTSNIPSTIANDDVLNQISSSEAVDMQPVEIIDAKDMSDSQENVEIADEGIKTQEINETKDGNEKWYKFWNKIPKMTPPQLPKISIFDKDSGKQESVETADNQLKEKSIPSPFEGEQEIIYDINRVQETPAISENVQSKPVVESQNLTPITENKRNEVVKEVKKDSDFVSDIEKSLNTPTVSPEPNQVPVQEVEVVKLKDNLASKENFVPSITDIANVEESQQEDEGVSNASESSDDNEGALSKFIKKLSPIQDKSKQVEQNDELIVAESEELDLDKEKQSIASLDRYQDQTAKDRSEEEDASVSSAVSPEGMIITQITTPKMEVEEVESGSEADDIEKQLNNATEIASVNSSWTDKVVPKIISPFSSEENKKDLTNNAKTDLDEVPSQVEQDKTQEESSSLLNWLWGKDSDDEGELVEESDDVANQPDVQFPEELEPVELERPDIESQGENKILPKKIEKDFDVFADEEQPKIPVSAAIDTVFKIEKAEEVASLAIPESVPEKAETETLVNEAVTAENLLTSIEFEKGKTDSNAENNKKIEQIVSKINSDSNARVKIVSYASQIDGQINSARRISLRRAIGVRTQLIKDGLESIKINVRAMGDSAGSGNKDRVDVFLIKSGS